MSMFGGISRLVRLSSVDWFGSFEIVVKNVLRYLNFGAHSIRCVYFCEGRCRIKCCSSF
jgi:hypothetical protein